jgi:hypothetical protein
MNATVTSPWEIEERDFPQHATYSEQVRFLLRYAILAPSSRNMQPWRFAADHRTVWIHADDERWNRIGDSDRRELYLSLGCALENLLVAAEHFGFRHGVQYFPIPSYPALAVVVELHPDGDASSERPPELFDAIPHRHTVHGLFSDRPIGESERRRLISCCVGEGLRLDLFPTKEAGETIDALHRKAAQILFADPAWRRELGHCIGSGALGTLWPLAQLAEFTVSHLNLGKQVAQHETAALMSAPLAGLISTVDDRPESQIRAGQVLERVWLRATSLGLSLQPMSEALEVPALRHELARIIPVLGMYPQQTIRLGYAKKEREHHSPRRELDVVMLVGEGAT